MKHEMKLSKWEITCFIALIFVPILGSDKNQSISYLCNDRKSIFLVISGNIIRHNMITSKKKYFSKSLFNSFFSIITIIIDF